MPKVINTSNNNISRNTLLLAHTSENLTNQTDSSKIMIQGVKKRKQSRESSRLYKRLNSVKAD